MSIKVLDRRAIALRNINVGEIAVTVEGKLRVYTRIWLPPYYHSDNLLPDTIYTQKLTGKSKVKEKDVIKTMIVELSNFSNQYTDDIDLDLTVRLLEAGEAVEISR